MSCSDSCEHFITLNFKKNLNNPKMLDGGQFWTVFNERRCVSSGYTICKSSLCSDLRFYGKDDLVLGVLKKSYFKENMRDWFKRDIMKHITPQCNFLYIFCEEDSVERMNEIVRYWKEKFSFGRPEKFAFIECPFCGDLALIGLPDSEEWNGLAMDGSRCSHCFKDDSLKKIFWTTAEN